ncbi:MAG: hypothetical protein K2X81_26850 [Candidatus Obscuribacterales bacterium]|nr:hypothetical protein [Candidatus Obscuribacterales bacterium]
MQNSSPIKKQIDGSAISQWVDQQKNSPITQWAEQQKNSPIMQWAEQQKNSPIMQWAEQHKNSPVMQWAEQHKNSSIMQWAEEYKNSPVMQWAEEHKNSPVMQWAEQYKNSSVMQWLEQQKNSSVTQWMEEQNRWSEHVKSLLIEPHSFKASDLFNDFMAEQAAVLENYPFRSAAAVTSEDFPSFNQLEFLNHYPTFNAAELLPSYQNNSGFLVDFETKSSSNFVVNKEAGAIAFTARSAGIVNPPQIEAIENKLVSAEPAIISADSKHFQICRDDSVFFQLLDRALTDREKATFACTIGDSWSYQCGKLHDSIPWVIKAIQFIAFELFMEYIKKQLFK